MAAALIIDSVRTPRGKGKPGSGAGVESMSGVPMGSDGGGIDGQNMSLRKKVFQVPQGISADLIATLDGVTREEVDRFAVESQQKAGLAIAEGRLEKSIFPVV